MSGPPDGPHAIETVGLGRDYGNTRALDALDLVVPAGWSVGLLGPNGAGKTTAMLVLATLLRPSRGVARVFGHDVSRDRAAVRQTLGLVFQEPSIDGLLTVAENLRFAARLSGLSGAAARRAVTGALERTGLVSRALQPARQLSTGWRRLADLARAMLHRPALLVLDEPTVGLDPEHRDRAWGLLETERRESGTAILFSTHYLTEAERCDWVVLLAKGRAVAADTPARLKALIGEEVVEIEGPGADRLLPEVQRVAAVQQVVRTDRGFRIGIAGSREDLARMAALTPPAIRFAVRPPTLDDVYFARTQSDGSPPSGAIPAGTPS
jgi:ABC-2 type transport system ATP-binding protein